jgi:haloalkane dehalogenase
VLDENAFVEHVPKLFVNAEPGRLLTGRLREACRRWPNQIEVTVPGLHFLQEDSPMEIARAIGEFIETSPVPADRRL